MKLSVAILAFIMIPAIISAQTSDKKLLNSLTKKEKKQGWQLLFDGQSLNGWKGYNSDNIFTCWSVSNGELVCQGEGGNVTAGDIITKADFDNFELSVDWSISKAGNSGIFYHVLEGKQYKAAYETGPEYQLIDDAGWPEKLEEWQKTGADYAMSMYTTIKDQKLMPVDE